MGLHTQISRGLRDRLLAGAAMGLMLALASHAHAQDAAAGQTAAPADEAAQVEEVIVTGSSIRGVPPVGSALTAVGRDEIVASGATTATELLRSVPSMGNFNATGINGGQDQANFVDQPAIHGIGVGNGGGGLTLVLMNGRRLPGAGINQTAPDASVIPPAAIERVEVVADGASSIYGSDAVAGVVNFILRKNFDGAETAGRAGYSEGGYRTYDFSQILGKTWDTGSIMGVYQYTANTALNGRHRDYITDNQTANGLGDNRSTLCSPANVTVGGVNYALSSSGATAGVFNRCEANKASDVYPEQGRHYGLISLRQQVSDQIELYATSLYTHRDLRTREATNAASNSKGGLSVTVDHGAYYDYARSLGLPAGAHSVTYDPSADFGDAFKNRITTSTVVNTFGGEFQLGKGWKAQAEGNFGFERDDTRQYGINQALALSAAAAGTLNPYGVGPSTNNALLKQVGDYETRYSARHTLQEGLLKADGPLFSLPAGQVKGAFGVSYRKESFDAGFREGPKAGPDAIPGVSTRGERKIFSAYGEAFVPLVSDANALPAVQRLDLSLSLRYDDYNDVGSTTNPKIGVNWRPIDDILIHGSYGQSFHAPSLADSGTAIDTRAIRFPDFINFDPSRYSIVLAGGNKLKPESADTYSVGFDYTPAFLPGLKASLTYFKINYNNVITFPTFAPVSEPFNPTYDKYRIYNPTLAQTQAALAGFRADGLIYPADPSLPTAIYDLRRQNFANQVIDGFDFDVQYRFTSPIGDLNAGVGGTKLDSFDQQIIGDANTTSRIGTNAAIEWKARFNLGWQKDGYSAAIFYNHTGGYDNITTSPATSVDAFNTIDLHLGWTVPEGSFGSGLELTFDASNLTDEDPPFYYDASSNAGARGYDPVAASALGRVLSVGVRKKW